MQKLSAVKYKQVDCTLNQTTNQHQKNMPRDERVLAKLCKQMEYYLGDANLAHDKYFRDLILKGPIQLQVFLNCNRIKELLRDYPTSTHSQTAIIGSAISSLSTMLKLTADERAVMRVIRYTPDQKYLDLRTIYIENLPVEADNNLVHRIFQNVDPHILDVQVITQYAFVTFLNPESVNLAISLYDNLVPKECMELKIVVPGGLKVISKATWMSSKVEFKVIKHEIREKIEGKSILMCLTNIQGDPRVEEIRIALGHVCKKEIKNISLGQEIIVKCTEEAAQQLQQSLHRIQAYDWKFANFEVRAYAASAIYEDVLLIHGGLSNRVIESFVAIDLKNISITHLRNPYPRAKHKAFVHGDDFYIFGGQCSQGLTNEICRFNLRTHKSEALPTNKSYPLPYENYGLCKGGTTVYIFGGFYTTKLDNTLYSYDISTNQFRVLSKNTRVPKREGCSLSYMNDFLYLFGGTNNIDKLMDFWVFRNGIWTELESNIKARSGHTASVHEGTLMLFGGIHTVTWELDDLWSWNGQWKSLETDSSRKVTRFELRQRAYHSMSPTRRERTEKVSFVKKKQEKISKDKKLQMLKQFHLDPIESPDRTPISNQMRTCLSNMGMQLDLQFSDFGKQTVSKFQQKQNRIVTKKRPCPRDGHCSEVHKGRLLIFGGDRHMMQFNDLYICNL